jgi:dinuclear metal center YbgI/SA1388 family protein
MTYGEILTILRRFAPEDTALEDDPIGLLIEPAQHPVRSLIVCLDATEYVVQKARDEAAELIVAHHPLIFKPLKRLESANPVSAAALALVRSGIGLYAYHTNWDTADGGINDTLADLLGLRDSNRLQGTPEARIVRVGQLAKPMTAEAFLTHVGDVLKCDRTSTLRYAAPCGDRREIRTVAVCGGAGAGLVGDAIKAGADAFVTADVRHHEFIDAASRGLLLIDAGHEATEAPGMQKLSRTLSAQLAGVFVQFCPNWPPR